MSASSEPPAALAPTARAHAALAHRRGVPFTYRKRRGLTPPSRTGGKRGGRRGASAGPPSRPPCIPPPRPPAGARRMQAGRGVDTPGSLPAPCPSPAGTGPAGLGAEDAGLARASRQVNEPREETSGGVRRGQARRGDARRGDARRGEASDQPKRLRFQGWNGENSKEPRLVRGLGADQLHLPRASSPGAARKPFTPRSPQSTELPYSPSPAGPVPAGDGQGAG
jgi:hypothetical protein